MAKRVLMIAGPNGAGKTTMALTLIPNLLKVYDFINADEIAKALAPLHPETVALTASKLMLKRLRELLEAERSFAFETTASGTNYVKHLKEARDRGYEINLMFLWLSGPDQAVRRVATRVKQGGHHVPEETIRRRYYAGLKNLVQYYLPIVDQAMIIDNSSLESKKIIARKNNASSLVIYDMKIWEEIEEGAHV